MIYPSQLSNYHDKGPRPLIQLFLLQAIAIINGLSLPRVLPSGCKQIEEVPLLL